MALPPTETGGIHAIVASFATRPDVQTDQIVDLYTKLMTKAQGATENGAEGEGRPLTPAVAVSEAVTASMVYCLCCGKPFKMLKRHLRAEHGLSEAEYRFQFKLAEDFPLVAPDYSEKKASQARASGLGKGRGLTKTSTALSA